MYRHTHFLTTLLLFLLLCPFPALADAPFIVVLDAGHGGGDVGTPHRKCKQDEKTIALNVTKRLGEMINEQYPDVKVVYTRTTDVYPTLPERTRKARESKGHLFISIHVNGANDSRAHGFETYVFGITGLQGKSEAEQKRIRERTMIERENLDIDGKQIDFEKAVDIETKILCQAQREKHNKYSLEVAHYVQDNLMDALRMSSYSKNAQDRGVKQKNIFVLCYSPMPAILVELGYMSNVAEEKFINTPEAQEMFAASIFKGFEQYRNNWQRRQLKDTEEEATPQPVVAAETKTEPKTEPAPKTVVETKPEAKTEAKVETKATTQEAKPVVESKPETKTEAKPEQKPVMVESKETPLVPQEECFRIQFLSSPTRLAKDDPHFKGLSPIYCYEANGYYRYTYGKGATRAELQEEILKVRALFPDSFIVRFDAQGQRAK